MHIGFTYDLRQDYLDKGYSPEETAEFDSAETIRYIETALAELGHRVERIGNLDSLVRRLAQRKTWDLVFNICEGLNGFSREAQVPALLDAYGIPYTFSDSLVLSVCLNKGITKHVMRSMGLPTADFYVIAREEDIEKVRIPFPLFLKPVSEGTSKGIDGDSRVENRDELRSLSAGLLKEFRQPVLVEEYLPGREFTVNILGTGDGAEVIGVLEVIIRPDADSTVYSFRNKEFCELLVKYVLAVDPAARDAAGLALAAWKGFGCRDAGRVDIRLDKNGKPKLLEINPLAGLHPTHSDLPVACTLAGISYRDLIDRIIRSAASRNEPKNAKGSIPCRI
ncbi:MAG: D-alanine--D-alanine ligase [Spirochaetales bacterium]|nr:D-alanine--D-alanine ligase [Spirochaetales bacterium]